MKRVALLMAALSLVFQASAVPVSVSEARQAAQAWASRGAVLGARLGAGVERASALSLASGEKAYAVKMTGGGTVFVAADDDLGPIVAFTAATNDFSAVDERSPLWALLNRDAALRAFVRTNAAAQASLRAAKAATAASAKTVASSATTHVMSAPDDLRVAPLVQSQWSQEDADGKLCYNLYTPILKTGRHAACGCVATAMAQIMRYHAFPTASVEPVTHTCYVNIYAATKARDPDCVTNLTTQAGVYDWANMPLKPADGVTDAQCEAIGKLTSDAGISVFMLYGGDSDGSSGAYYCLIPNALMGVFGYANAAFYAADEITANAGAMKRAMFSNIDAGYPVLMGISGVAVGGHAIVGDGYGYQDGTLYVHLNMGWSGQDDYWYNLPNVDCYYNFTIFDDLIFNIFPTAADGAESATLSGRVTDEAGAALAGAAVRVYEAGTTTLVTNGVTSATGVYGFLVPAGTFDVEFEKAGCPVERVASVRAAATTTEKQELIASIVESLNWNETYPDIPVVTSVGNAYGVDATIVEPRARIVLGPVTNVYATLDKALAAAKAFVAGDAPGVAIEVLGELPLGATATIDFPCALTTAADAADGASVVRAGTAALAVASGGTLALSNVTFAANSSTAVTVASGGCLAVASDVDFGVTPSIAAVTTADASGFVMAGELTAGFAIDCAAAPDVGGIFGMARCDYLTASNSAAMVSNVRDTLGETRGVAVEEGGVIRLEWADGVLVPLADSAGYFVDATGATNTAARLDRVFEKYASLRTAGKIGDSGEIVVRNLADLTLTNRVAVSGSLALRAETAGVTIASLGGAAGFDVGDGATLNVTGISFDGYTGDSLFRVDGGTLNLAAVEILNATGTNRYSGAVAVLKGAASLSNSVISNGNASGIWYTPAGTQKKRDSSGGGVFLEDAGCSLALADTAIVDCEAKTFGGGVYAGAGATVTLAGDVNVTDNVSQLGDDNLCLIETDNAEASLTLIRAVTGAVGVRWKALPGTSPRSIEGGAFATGAASVLAASASAFANDADATLVAAVDEDAAALVWATPQEDSREVEPSVATVKVIPADGDDARYYANLADAAAMLTGDATIELLADDTLTEDAEIAYAVTLRSSAGASWTVSRATDSDAAIAVVTNAALTVTNVTLSGGAGPFLRARGGELTLSDGATVRDVSGAASRDASAVWVGEGATFTMTDGAVISNCENAYFVPGLPTEAGWGGGLYVERAKAYLLGGTVTGCAAWLGGGVMAGSESEIFVSGAVQIDGNVRFEENDGAAVRSSQADDFAVSKNSRLVLSDVFTGDIGYVPGVLVPSNVFGVVASDFSGTDAQLANSAHGFTHDLTGDVGLAMMPESGSGEKILVWSDAVDANGNVTVNGTNYVMVSGGATLTAAVTDSTTSLTYTGAAQTPTLEGHGFVVSVTAQTNAGDYTATLTPKAGFAWDDGTTTARTVNWTIAKATYDMRGITFESQTVAYDGEPHSLAISGTLPDGVTVSYTGNGQTEVGEYTVTATFTIADPANYEAIPALTATLTIVEKVDPPEPDPPTPSVVTNVPTPIAFQSIERLAEGSWRLVVTNRVPWCWYRLLSTDDLTKGFTTTNAWEQASADATPAWTNDVETTVEARFWRAEGKEGEVGE